MSIADGLLSGLAAPLPVPGASLPLNLAPYAGSPNDILEGHDARYDLLVKSLEANSKLREKLLKDQLEEDYGMGQNKMSEFVGSDPQSRRQYFLAKLAENPGGGEPSPQPAGGDFGGLADLTAENIANAAQSQVQSQEPVEQSLPPEVQPPPPPSPPPPQRPARYTPTGGEVTPLRRAMQFRDFNSALAAQRQVDPIQPKPVEPPPPPPAPPEMGYFERAKQLGSDFLDTTERYGRRLVRSGARGVQQLANYGIRNSDFLESLVDDDQEALLLASLAESNTGEDRQFYIDQLNQLSRSKQPGVAPEKSSDRDFNFGGYTFSRDYDVRTQEQQDRIKRLSDAYSRVQDGSRPYNEVDNPYAVFRREFLDNQKKQYPDTEGAADRAQRAENYYGPAFDYYYGRNSQGGLRGPDEVPLYQDSLYNIGSDALSGIQRGAGNLYDSASSGLTRFREALGNLPDEARAFIDPSSVAQPKPVPLQSIDTIGVGSGMATDAAVDLATQLGVPLSSEGNIDIQEAGIQLNSLLSDTSDTESMDRALSSLELMSKSLPPEQVTRAIVAMEPRVLGDLQSIVTKGSDQEAIAAIEKLDPQYADKLYRFMELSSRYVMPQMSSRSYAGNKISPVRRATPEEVARTGGLVDRVMQHAPFTSQYIDPRTGIIDTEFLGTGIRNGEGQFFRLPDDGAPGTLLYNPQTGEFNREYFGNLDDIPELPPEYEGRLRASYEESDDRFLPTMGRYF